MIQNNWTKLTKMTAESEKILEAFPHQTIHPIVGQPSYETISELHLKPRKYGVSALP